MTQGTPEVLRSTDRGLGLLRNVADSPEGLALADLARLSGLSASTALRQLRSLEGAGFVARSASGTWVPGPELLRIARTLAGFATLPRLAEPVLSALSSVTGESSYLSEPLDDATAVYVAMHPAAHSVRHVSWLGRTVPRRATAAGRALAGRVDADGAVVVADSVEPEVTAVASPVCDAAGVIVAAVSVVGPSFRLAGDSLAVARRAVVAHAAHLSYLAGGVGP